MNKIKMSEKEAEALQKKFPGIRIDNSLTKYKDLPIFQEKLDKANETLRRVGMPKENIYKKSS